MNKLYRSETEGRIALLAQDNDHRTLAIWGAECAERVLPMFEAERPGDGRPRAAIGTLREFVASGRFSMKVIREASLTAHAAAREVPDGPACYAARAAGQAVAARAIRALHDEARAESEREWQHRRLVELTADLGDAEVVRLFRIR